MSSTRRSFLVSAAAGAALTPFLGAAGPAAAGGAVRPAGLRSSLQERLRSRHRNLFNGDTCTFFYNPEMWQPEDFVLKEGQGRNGRLRLPVGGPFQAKAIHRYVGLLADSGIDTFVINANASRAWYPSRRIPSILDGYRRGDREFFRGHAHSAGAHTPDKVDDYLDQSVAFYGLYQDLIDAGVDWLAETAKACRARGISPWVSVRMNDFHGWSNPAGSFFNHPLLAQPEMRLKRSAYSPTMRNPLYREGLNFERAEVRAALFAQIREVVDDYDFEGLELDWLRNPMCCEPNASAETIAMMTAWLREIRALVDARAQQTGRPYPLGLRIPGRLETLRSIGLDVEALCREGVIDWVAVSGFWCTSWEMPHDDLRRQLGDATMIYGVLEAGANVMPTRSADGTVEQQIRRITTSREMLRANAAGKLALGADALEWFNFYTTDQARIPGVISDYGALRDLHRLEALRGQTKHYVFSRAANVLTHIPFEVPPQLPLALPAAAYHPFRLPMCVEPTDASLDVVVQVIVRAGEEVGALPISFNASWPRLAVERSDQPLFPCGSLTHHVADHVAYNVRFPLTLIREGWNEIVVENGGPTTLTLIGLEVGIMPRREAST
jgi:hypothetical protein